MRRPLFEKFLLYQVRTKKDPEAFGKIYDLYAARIYRFVFFKVSSEEEAQDLTSDVFLKTWQALLEENAKEVRHLGAFLYSIARNRVIDHYRSRAAREVVPLQEEAEDQLMDERMLQEKNEAKIDTELLSTHLRALKDEYREVLLMRYLDEYEIGEIAKLTDKTSGNVRVLLHRATNALRDVINKQDHVGSQAGSTTEVT